MNSKIVQKLVDLPKKPGVYLYRNKDGTVIYVGKAVNLKNRVSSYFKSKNLDPKTAKLVQNIRNMETIVCESEIEALILESELIKRYRPKYNFEWKDDKNFCYIRISNEEYPKVEIIRQVIDHDSTYFGPFVDSRAVRTSLKALRHIFPYCTCRLPSDRVCLYYHLGLCPGHGPKYTTTKEYQKNIKNLVNFLKGEKEYIRTNLERQMRREVKNQHYEKAAETRDKLAALGSIRFKHVFKETRDLSLDKALSGLAESLKLESIPERIECYDISNISGKAAVGSMVVFSRGLPKRSHYRRFQIKTVKQIDDFGMLQEVLRRRFAKIGKGKDVSFQSKPDLIIIDGGKGQLSASQRIITELGQKVSLVGLAKKHEEVYSLNEKKEFTKTVFPENSEVRFLLQRIRDEAHRFAITYHRNLRSKAMTSSALEEIEGIGPKTRKKLISHFGSVKKIKEASLDDLAQIAGSKLAEKIKREL